LIVRRNCVTVDLPNISQMTL